MLDPMTPQSEKQRP